MDINVYIIIKLSIQGEQYFFTTKDRVFAIIYTEYREHKKYLR